MKRHLFFLLILVSFGQTAFGKKLELDADNLNAKVSVSTEQLKLKVDPGKKDDYSVKTGRNFEFTIGGCKLGIVGSNHIEKDVQFDITVNKREKTIHDLNTIVVDKKKLKFTGGKAASISFDCNVVFEPIKSTDDKMISLELSGDVPKNFNVKSEAEIYQAQEGKASMSDATLALYIGIGVVVLFFLVVSSIGGGYMIHRNRKKKKAALLEEQAAAKRSAEQAEAEKAAAEKAAAEKITAEKLVEERTAAEKASSSKSKIQKEASVQENNSDKTSRMVNSKSEKTKNSKMGSTNRKLKAKHDDNFINAADDGFLPAHLVSEVSKN